MANPESPESQGSRASARRRPHAARASANSTGLFWPLTSWRSLSSLSQGEVVRPARVGVAHSSMPTVGNLDWPRRKVGRHDCNRRAQCIRRRTTTPHNRGGVAAQRGWSRGATGGAPVAKVPGTVQAPLARCEQQPSRCFHWRRSTRSAHIAYSRTALMLPAAVHAH